MRDIEKDTHTLAFIHNIDFRMWINNRMEGKGRGSDAKTCKKKKEEEKRKCMTNQPTMV